MWEVLETLKLSPRLLRSCSEFFLINISSTDPKEMDLHTQFWIMIQILYSKLNIWLFTLMLRIGIFKQASNIYWGVLECSSRLPFCKIISFGIKKELELKIDTMVVID